MDMTIDEIAQDIVSFFEQIKYLEEQYTGSNRNSMLQKERENYKQAIKEMLHKMDYDEGMFSVVEEPYMVAKSLYFMLTQDYLSEEEQMSAIKLCYFCLLKNFLMNKDTTPVDLEYGDLVSGCKLGLVLISMQTKYLMYSIIAGQAHYINPEAHLKNQILLFGGIIKHADSIATTDYLWPLESVIKDYYQDIFKELDRHINLPTKMELTRHIENCTPVIKSIVSRIRDNFKEESVF